MISAVLLAAGESRRMGDFKQLLRFGAKTFVERCVDQLLASRVDEVIVVTGHRESEVRRAVGDRLVKFAHNADYRSGMTSSIQCGVRASGESAQALIVALVDQPRIGAEIVNRLVEMYEEPSHPMIVIPSYQGRNGHPILIDLRLKEEILNLQPTESLRQVVRAHSDEIVRIEIASPAVVEDCDLPEDYERLLNQ